jgi:hypothetical protein
MRLVLCRTAPGAQTSVLPTTHGLSEWHATLMAEIEAGLGAAFAGILAAPKGVGNGVEWIADGERAIAASALPATDRGALMVALGSMLADIARLASDGHAPSLAATWPAWRQIPDENFVFAVDGHPVLAAWGHRATSFADPLEALLPSLPVWSEPVRSPSPDMVKPRRTVWPWAAGFLAAAFVIGLVLPGLVLRPFTCDLPPGIIPAITASDSALARNAMLSTQLAQLDEQAAKQKAACPGALPAQAWNAGSLGMLQGCWHLTSDMKMQHENTGQVVDVSSWIICFNADGSGNQNIKLSDGLACTGPLAANFNAGHQLIMEEPALCEGRYISVYQGHWICQRVSDSQANCARTDKGGTSQGVFQR